jgi:hypothetical protein
MTAIVPTVAERADVALGPLMTRGGCGSILIQSFPIHRILRYGVFLTAYASRNSCEAT